MRKRDWGVGIVATAILATIMGATGASAQTSTGTKQARFATKRVLLLHATKPADQHKVLAPELEDAVKQSLRNLFSAPHYRATAPPEAAKGILGESNTGTATATEPNRDLSPAEVTQVLVAAGKKAEVDRVILAVVRDASSRQVTIALWNVDVQTGKATAEGQTLRRNWSDYPQTKPTNDGGYTTGVTLPPMKTADQKRLINRMLTEWHMSKE